ncbi:DUF4041 domain-containing protein [Romboutsia hominis]|uniref:DUF4041 domain-containing protein n=2 Tax=Romboutsia faecis TaxID=2764597 RepID=A0ABR7JN69_9FIRM|nr:DUF4041 domain-containing protein [Romboutsia faecis]
MGIITGILGIILNNQIKKNIDLKQSKLDLENDIKNNKEEMNKLEEEFNLMKSKRVSELKKIDKDIDWARITKRQEERKIEDLKNNNSIIRDIVNLEEKKNEFKGDIKKLEEELNNVSNKLELTTEVLNYQELEEDLYTFQVGMFDKKYEYELSEEYNEQLKLNRVKQKEVVKKGEALNTKDINDIFSYSVKDSEKKRYINNIHKLIIRTFNNECDIIINKLSVANIENSRKRLESAKEQINKLVLILRISINMEYYKLKVDELQLQYEYLIKIQEEREEQREIKERMREEAKIQAEINKLEKEAEKEQLMYEKMLEKVKAELEKASLEEKSILELKIQNLEKNLKEAEEKMKRAESMAQKTRAGYVYIISNIGSFGEDVYKIGMTRRLEPMDRVKELSDASVPFSFDVHAMIYSEDAPTLEKDLHNKFNEKRLNKINLRKEFFNVKLSEIEEEVNNITGASIKFTKLAEALEYRQSKLM